MSIKTLTFSLFALLFLFSCNKEETPEPVDERDAFVGSYWVQEQCGNYADNYTVRIQKSGNGLTVYNLYDVGGESDARVINSKLKIDNLLIGTDDNYCRILLADAIAIVDGNHLNIDFKVEARKDNTDLLSFSHCDPFEINCYASGRK
jgi:hypothetical protein